MSPFIQQIIGAIVRTAIVWIAAKFGAEISDDQAVQLAAQIAPIVAVIAWSIYQKYHNRLKLLTAQASPGGKTEREIDHLVSAGMAPSVMTGKDRVPA